MTSVLLNIVSFLYLAAFAMSGYLAAHYFFRAERPIVQIWLGGVAALLMLLWLPALFGFLLGFTLLAQLLALAICIALGLFFLLKRRRSWKIFLHFKAERTLLLTLAPFLLIGVYLLFTHTIRPEGAALHVGQSTFGDLPLHLGLVTSIGEQGFFPPDYSIYPGTTVGYPFLCDSISATFYVLGADLRLAMLLPAIFAYALVLLGIYMFFERWLKEKAATVLAVLLFLVGGGFGFAYFFDTLQDAPHHFSRIFTAFYQTPTNYADVGILWVNSIADMLVPQRATLFGWALLFPCLYLLRRAAFEKEKRLFIPLGIIAGLLPLVHTHSFLALGLVSVVYFFHALGTRQKKTILTGYLAYALIAILLATPQLLLFTFRQSAGEGFLSLHFNWANDTDTFLWFYIKNLGLLFLLLPLAFFHLTKEERVFYGGALLIWVVSEFIQFQPNPYDNNKLLFVWFAFTCGIVAKLLAEFYQILRQKQIKGRMYLAGLTIAVLFLSGLLTLGREWVSDYELIGADEAQAAAFVKENTKTNALFLTATNHNNAVAALTGRNILCGTGAYLYFHGIDYVQREAHVRLLFEEPEEYFGLLKSDYPIDYVWLSDAELYSYHCDTAYFSRFPVVYENDTVTIYHIIDDLM